MTDTTTVKRPTSAERPEDDAAPARRLFDLSATQLAGGALAAMTSAVIGARLGVAGTLAGAAIGSIVAGVAGALYTASLKHTRDKITSAIVAKVGTTIAEVTPDDSLLTASPLVAIPANRPRTAPEKVAHGQLFPTRTVPPAEEAAHGQLFPTRTVPPAQEAAHGQLFPTRTVPPAQETAHGQLFPAAGTWPHAERSRAGKRRPWKAVLISTATVFLLAVAGITGLELATGQAVSGGQGTTIAQVSDGGSGGSRPASAEGSADPDASTDPEPSDTGSVSADPSATAGSDPSAASDTGATVDPGAQTSSTGSEPSSEASPGGGASASDGSSASADPATDGSGTTDSEAAAGR